MSIGNLRCNDVGFSDSEQFNFWTIGIFSRWLQVTTHCLLRDPVSSFSKASFLFRLHVICLLKLLSSGCSLLYHPAPLSLSHLCAHRESFYATTEPDARNSVISCLSLYHSVAFLDSSEISCEIIFFPRAHPTDLHVQQ